MPAPPIRQREVPGAYGIGKVKIVYKPKPPRKTKFLSFFVYFTFFSLIYISYAFSVPSLRDGHVLPLFRTITKLADKLCVLCFSKLPAGLYEYSTQFYDSASARNITIVQGETLSEVLFQQGQKHALDRLYQMEISRRIARGRLSEVMGEKTLALDRFLRALDLARRAEQDYAEMDEEERGLLQAYSEGVNSVLMEEHTYGHSLDFTISSSFWGFFFDERKYPFQSWTPADSLVVARLLFYQQWGGDWEHELTQHLVEMKLGGEKAKVFQPFLNDERVNIATLMEFIPTLGANIIAVGKERSASKSAFLVHDFHSVNDYFNFWYANELRVPSSSFSVSGLSFPGVPFVLSGRNEFFSWALARSTSTDSEDVYVSNPHDARLLLPSTQREEEIVVFGRNESEWITVEDTRLGPNILPFVTDALNTSVEIAGYSNVVLCSSTLRERLSFDFFRRLNQANSVEDVNEATTKNLIVALHLVVATKEGEVGEVVIGRDVLRSSHVNGKRPIRVDSRSVNISTTNHTERQKLITSKDRAVFVLDALSASSFLRRFATSCHASDERRDGVILPACAESLKDGLSKDEVQRGLNDIHSPSGEQWGALLQRAFSRNEENRIRESTATEDEFSFQSSPNPYVAEASLHYNDLLQRDLESFNGLYQPFSIAPTYVEAFRVAFIENIVHPVGSLSSLLLGRACSPIFRASKLQGLLAKSTPKHFTASEHVWLLKKTGGLDQMTMIVLEHAVGWIDSNFDTKKMHKLVSKNASVLAAIQSPSWNWARAHAVTWTHPVVKLSPFLDVVWSLGPEAIPGTIDTVFRSSYRTDLGLFNNDALKASYSLVTAGRMNVEMSQDEFMQLSLPTTASLRAAINFFHSKRLRDFIAPAMNHKDSFCSSSSPLAAKSASNKGNNRNSNEL